MKQVAELLESHLYQNKAGSSFIFKDNKVVKNEEIIGTYRLRKQEENNFIVITSLDSGSIEFKVEIKMAEHPVVIELYSKNTGQAFMTLQEAEGEMQYARGPLKNSF